MLGLVVWGDEDVNNRGTVWNLLINSIDANECVIEFVDEAVELDIVLLVFTMVFDLVCYRRLKIKLHAIGIYSVATSWIISFLTNKKQVVKVQGHRGQILFLNWKQS